MPCPGHELKEGTTIFTVHGNIYRGSDDWKCGMEGQTPFHDLYTRITLYLFGCVGITNPKRWPMEVLYLWCFYRLCLQEYTYLTYYPLALRSYKDFSTIFHQTSLPCACLLHFLKPSLRKTSSKPPSNRASS